MPRSKVPASQNKSNQKSNAEKQRLAEIEEFLKGTTHSLYQNPPKNLTRAGKIIYKKIILLMNDLNLLSDLDETLLERLAMSIDRLRQCDKTLNKEGLHISEKDRYGHIKIKEHPSVKTEKTYTDIFMKCANQLGLSPSSRAQLAQLKFDKLEEETDPLNMLEKEANAYDD